MRFDYERFNRRYGPWVSLALGVATVAFVRRGAGYAPAAVAFLVLAWTLALLLRHRLRPPTPDDAPSPLRRLLPAAAATTSVGLYQNVLFYLVPVWGASATWPSANAAFPLILAAMALFSCFEYPYRAHVMDRPAVLGIFSAVTLFAACVPAFTVLLDVPLRFALALSAVVGGLAAGAAVVPALGLSWRRSLPAFLGAVGLSLGLLVGAGPLLLPPVPVVCAASGAGTGVVQRRLEGASDRFPAGVPRVYAHFSVAAPPGWSQPVRFRWNRDGSPSGAPLEGEVTGGREGGFRTWTWRSRPGPGDWRVDLVTDSGQLVGRVRFRVDPPGAPGG